jgi:hypothetical protein
LWTVAKIRNVSEPCDFKLHIRALGYGKRYSNVNSSFLHQPTLLAEATLIHRLAIPLLNAAFRLSVPSQMLFCISCGFVVSY